MRQPNTKVISFEMIKLSGPKYICSGLLFLLMLFLLGCQSKEVRYIPDHNERFGFELVYPSFMAKDPPTENGDGISCQGGGMELVAYGGMDPRCLGLDEEDLEDVDIYPEDSVFYVKSFVDSTGMVHCKKSAHFPHTDNGDVIITLMLTYPEGEIDTAVINTILKSFLFPES